MKYDTVIYFLFSDSTFIAILYTKDKASRFKIHSFNKLCFSTMHLFFGLKYWFNLCTQHTCHLGLYYCKFCLGLDSSEVRGHCQNELQSICRISSVVVHLKHR